MKENNQSLLLCSILAMLLGFAELTISQTEPVDAVTTTGNEATDSGATAPTHNHANKSLIRQQALSEALPADEVVWLKAGDERLLALYLKEQRGQARGGVIILAEHYHQPSERYWINNLRHTLPTKQWHSLVLAMPEPSFDTTANTAPEQVMAANAPNHKQSDEQGHEQVVDTTTKQNTTETTPNPSPAPQDPVTDNAADKSASPSTPSYQRRAFAAIDAAIRYFNDQGIYNMAIVSEGSSAVYAMQYISNNSDQQIRGLAIINARNPFNDTRLIELIAEQSLPLLDIYFGLDYRDQREAQQRKVASRKLASGQYLQIELPRIATRWDNHEGRLSKRVRGWLDRTASGFEVESPAQ